MMLRMQRLFFVPATIALILNFILVVKMVETCHDFVFIYKIGS